MQFCLQSGCFEVSKSKKTESDMAHEQKETAVSTSAAPALPLPKPLIAAFFLVLFLGTGLYATRDKRTESNLSDALRTCNASVRKDDSGLSDAYGVVQFSGKTSEMAEYLSLCEMRPELAARIFRNALKEDNSSARMIAVYSAFFLTSQKQLTAEDFGAIANLLKPPASDSDKTDLRKVAHRALSDLIVCAKVDDAVKFEALPPNLPATKNDKSPAYKIQTREETLGDKKVLGIRWSDADLAYAWWQAYANKGSWNKELQRFVVTDARLPDLTPPQAPVPPVDLPKTSPKN